MFEFFQVLFSSVEAPAPSGPEWHCSLSSVVAFIVSLFPHCYLSFLSANTRPPLGVAPICCGAWGPWHLRLSVRGQESGSERGFERRFWQLNE